MSNGNENERGRRPTPWYSHPAARATYAILGVGIALAALLNDKCGPVGPDHPPGKELPSPSPLPTNNGEDVKLSAETNFSQVIQGHTVRLEDSVHTDHPIFIVAESVILSKDATIHAPDIWIFSKSVTGGTLDVSGADGTAEKKDGFHAGSIYILAKSVEGVNIKAIGGRGQKGDKGSRGKNGSDGNCDGFGKWEPAKKGGDGGPGGTGGRGGDGGNVRIVFGDSYRQQPFDLSRGEGGEGGEGGGPGSGGDGCVGFGGVQSDASGGSYGPRGANGPPGLPGTLTTEKKDTLVTEILTWLRDRSDRLTVATLQHVVNSEQRNSAP